MLPQLLFRLRELLATWARGSERMRYLRGGWEVPDVALRLGWTPTRQMGRCVHLPGDPVLTR